MDAKCGAPISVARRSLICAGDGRPNTGCLGAGIESREAVGGDDGSTGSRRRREAIKEGTKREGGARLRVVGGRSVFDGDGGWEVFATFVVEFQRRHDDRGIFHRSVAHRMESGDSAVWEGVVALALVRWILRSLDANKDALTERGDVGE